MIDDYKFYIKDLYQKRDSFSLALPLEQLEIFNCYINAIDERFFTIFLALILEVPIRSFNFLTTSRTHDEPYTLVPVESERLNSIFKAISKNTQGIENISLKGSLAISGKKTIAENKDFYESVFSPCANIKTLKKLDLQNNHFESLSNENKEVLTKSLRKFSKPSLIIACELAEFSRNYDPNAIPVEIAENPLDEAKLQNTNEEVPKLAAKIAGKKTKAAAKISSEDDLLKNNSLKENSVPQKIETLTEPPKAPQSTKSKILQATQTVAIKPELELAIAINIEPELKSVPDAHKQSEADLNHDYFIKTESASTVESSLPIQEPLLETRLHTPLEAPLEAPLANMPETKDTVLPTETAHHSTENSPQEPANSTGRTGLISSMLKGIFRKCRS